MNLRSNKLFFALLTSLFITPTIYAADILTEPTAPIVKKRTGAEEKQIIEKRKRIADKKTDLNGSSWDIVYISSSDPKQKGKKDLLTFQNGQFNSKSLMDRGFTWTNYTISVPDEESELAVWETMQTGKEGIVFVHGEWAKDKMSGNITEQLDGGKKTVEHSFSTSTRTAIPASTEEGASEGASDEPKPSESIQEAGGVLVSKEAVAPDLVKAFEPGTTDEKS